MPDPPLDPAAEWAREKRRHRLTMSKLLGSHAAPFFIAWIAGGAFTACLAYFAFDAGVLASIVSGLFFGLVIGLRVVLRFGAR